MVIKGQVDLVLCRVGGVNLESEKGDRITMDGKCSGEIRGESGEVTGVVADVPNMDSLGKSYEVFDGWVWQLEKWSYCWWLVRLM